MKKLLCLMLSLMLLFSFAACGEESGGTTNSNSTPSVDDNGSKATAISFDAESYTVAAGEYIELIDHVTVEPAGEKVTFSCSDESIAEVFSAARGEILGAAVGEVTITVTSGKVSATCKLNVIGLGNICARDDATNTGGSITNKRWMAAEKPVDTNAYIVIISKDIAENADMSNAVALNAGTEQADGMAIAQYDGYYVINSDNTGNYRLENVPVGEYVGLIVSSNLYAYKTYTKDAAIAQFKETEIASYFTDAEINTLVSSFYNREFHVGTIKVEATKTSIFTHAFRIDGTNT